MLTKTTKGYSLGVYEGIPSKLDSGRKITVTETRAALCRINGLSQIEAARAMNCSKGNIAQMWQSIFFKTNTSNALTAVLKLIDLGVIKHLVIFLLIAGGLASEVSNTDNSRPFRSKQTRLRNKRSNRLAIFDNNLITLVGLTAAELYSESDLGAMS
jgi:DNA-binding CsgD family transcriptional regulator